MKKNMFLVAITGLVISTLCGCGISVKGADGTEYESYQECCAANDYDAAHLFLAKMKNNISQINESKDKRAYEEAKEYVFKKEALFLMSQGDDAAKKRIIYLLKEEGGNDDHVSMLIDLAIENGDAELVKTLMGQYKTEKKYYYDDIDKQNKELEKLIKFFAEKRDEEYVFNLLTEFENKIPQKPAIGKIKMSDTHYESSCESFSRAVTKYNNVCRIILISAIGSHNGVLAQKILSKFKSNIKSVELSSRYEGNDYYYVYNTTVDNEDITSAKATYQEAVRNGAFK